MKPLSHRLALSLLAAAVSAPLVAHAGTYSVYKAGLYDSSPTAISHTGTSGGLNFNTTTISQFNALGDAAGISTRYQPGTTNASGNNAWYYDATTQKSTVIGLVDGPVTGQPSHTSNFNASQTGTQSSNIFSMNSSGQVAGTSALYNGTNGQQGSIGASAWLFTPGTGVTQIGFYQAAGDIFTLGYASTDIGAATSAIGGLDNAGDVTGTSFQFEGTGTSSVGQSAFYYNAAKGNQVIGLNTGSYAKDDGNGGTIWYSTLYGMNANGQVVGYSRNYNNSNNQDAWFYNPTVGPVGTSVRIGLTGAGTSANIFNTGAVAGTTGSASNASSQSAWVYNIASGVTKQVGLTSGTFTTGTTTVSYVGPVSSTQSSSVSALNAFGQAIGSSTIYAAELSQSFPTTPGDVSVGSDAFFFDGTSTTTIGLTDTRHTASPMVAVAGTNRFGQPTGYSTYTFRNNIASNLNSVGNVVGTAARFNTTGSGASAVTAQVGQNAWYFTPAVGPVPASNVIIGLVDSTTSLTAVSHTSTDTVTQSSTVVALNNAGQAVGTSTRYVGTTTKGADAYIYSPLTGSVAIGLNTGTNLASDGTVSDTVNFLTQSGLVAGTATRYVTGTTNSEGTDVWLYDSNTLATYTITPSVSSTGTAVAAVRYLGENGLVLGTFTVESGSFNVTDIFAYMEGGSIIDLGATSTDLTITGWQNLASLTYFSGNAFGGVAATGLLTGESSNSKAGLIFVAPAAVPEPASLGLLSMGVLALAARRRNVKQ